MSTLRSFCLAALVAVFSCLNALAWDPGAYNYPADVVAKLRAACYDPTTIIPTQPRFAGLMFAYPCQEGQSAPQKWVQSIQTKAYTVATASALQPKHCTKTVGAWLQVTGQALTGNPYQNGYTAIAYYNATVDKVAYKAALLAQYSAGWDMTDPVIAGQVQTKTDNAMKILFGGGSGRIWDANGIMLPNAYGYAANQPDLPSWWVKPADCNAGVMPTATPGISPTPTPTPGQPPIPTVPVPTPTPTVPVPTPTAAPATQPLCRNLSTGVCAPLPPMFGTTCPAGFVPCDSVSPTPTPGVTATPTPGVPTPTPTPITATVTRVATASDIGMTYCMGCTMIGGVVWCNCGVCCPGIGTGPGECLVTFDYNSDPPVARVWFCTYANSSEWWEVGSVQVARSDRYSWVVAGQATRRPAVPALQNESKTPRIWGLGLASLTAEGFSWTNSAHDIIAGFDFGQIWPQGILDLGGRRWLYVQTSTAAPPFYVRRFEWSDADSSARHDGGFLSEPMPAGTSGIAIDADGSLIATVDEKVSVATTGMTATIASITVHPMWWPSQDSTLVRIIRSRDEGRTWSDTGISIKAPAGRTLFGCGFEHRSGGGAVQPLHLICTIGSGLGPDVTPSDQNIGDIRLPGAKLPASWGKKPVLWK